MPQRIQRRRVRGWQMPADAIYVGRPTRWGNPLRLSEYLQHADTEVEARYMVVHDFESLLRSGRLGVTVDDVRRELRGKDLVCWCPLEKKCHADVFLRVAAEEDTK